MIMELNNTRIIIEFKNRNSKIMDHVIRIDDNYKYDGNDYIQIAFIEFNPESLKRHEMHMIINKKEIDNIKVKLL